MFQSLIGSVALEKTINGYFITDISRHEPAIGFTHVRKM